LDRDRMYILLIGSVNIFNLIFSESFSRAVIVKYQACLRS
jgi:hypothetical protein